MLRPKRLLLQPDRKKSPQERPIQRITQSLPGARPPEVLPTRPRICVIRSVGGIGDVLMATPALREWKRQHPNGHLTFAIDRHTTYNDTYWLLVKNAPFIDQIIDARHVDRRKYHQVYDISSCCIQYEHSGMPILNRIDIFARHIGVGAVSSGVPFYQVEEQERAWANEEVRGFLGRMGRPKAALMALHTASNDPKRCWSIERYYELIEDLTRKDPRVAFYVFDFNQVGQNWDRYGNVRDASGFDIRQMAAMFEQCDLLVAPDSGPMHLAAAVGVETLALFGPIPPQARLNHYPTHTAVTADGFSCPCQWYVPCHAGGRCMSGISAGKVSELAHERLSRARSRVVLESVLSPCDGYGGSAEGIAIALSKKVLVRYSSNNTIPGWESLCRPETPELVRRSFRAPRHLAYHPALPLTQGDLLARYRALFTMFESTRPPRKWGEYSNRYDLVIVPCRGLVDGFREIGVRVPIEVVPLGVDPERWSYQARDFGRGPFRFLLFANSHFGNRRKNYQAALDAFRLAFPNPDGVELWLKTTVGGIPDEIKGIPGVFGLDARMDHGQLTGMLGQCHCLVFPSKGEGFGLPVREAMSTGMPVIAAPFMGLQEPMRQEFNFPIEYEMELANYEQIFDSPDLGFWALPSVSSLAEQMLKVFESRGTLGERSQMASAWVRDHESYSRTADLLLGLLR